MPDINGTLNPEDNAKIQKWWSGHWKGTVVCPVCKTTEWTQAPHVVNIQRHAVDANAPSTISYPHIVVTCKSCAHSMFFNAVQIGVSPAAAQALPIPLPPVPIFPAPSTTTTNALARALGTAEPPANSLGNLFKKD
jgi:predicted nucleic-acid-binding Zn-ribbon protein